MQYLCEAMPSYVALSNAQLIMYKIQYSNMMCYFKGQVNIFNLFLLGFSSITVLSVIWQGANRINFAEIGRKKSIKEETKDKELKESLVE